MSTQYSSTETQSVELEVEVEMWKSMLTDASQYIQQQQQPVPHRHEEQQHVNEQDTVDILQLKISQLQRMLEVHIPLSYSYCVLATIILLNNMLGCRHHTAVCLSACDAVHCGSRGWCRG